MGIYDEFEYGSSVVYGSFEPSTAENTYVFVHTPARDMVEIVTKQYFVVDDYLRSSTNYSIVDPNGNSIDVRAVLEPKNRVRTKRIFLFTRSLRPGTLYTITMQNLRRIDGVILSPISADFRGVLATADSVLGNIPDHYNKDPQTSNMRHLLQAIAEADDRIGK